MVEFQQLRSELDVLRERSKQTNNPAERQALIRNAGKLLADLEAAVQQSQKELAELRKRPVVDVARVSALRTKGLGWKRIASELGVGVGALYRLAEAVPKFEKGSFEPSDLECRGFSIVQPTDKCQNSAQKLSAPSVTYSPL